MCKIRSSPHSTKLCCATCSSGDRTGLLDTGRTSETHKMSQLGVNPCFLNVLCLFSSFLQLTTLIGLCLTLYRPVAPMPPSHQVRKDTCTHMHFFSVFSYGALSPVMAERYREPFLGSAFVNVGWTLLIFATAAQVHTTTQALCLWEGL